MKTITDSDLDDLGQLLKKARQQSGMSQRQAAEAANISPTYVRALETSSNPNTNKPSRPSPAVLMAMGNALKVSPEILLDKAGYDPELTKQAAPTISGAAQRAIEWDLRRMRDAAKKLNQRHDFIKAQTVERLSKFTTEFLAMADGTFRCGAEEEPYLTRVAYRQAKSTIRAVSYQDEQWWESKHGRDYLRLHDEVRNKGIEITRIFLVPEDKQRDLKKTFERHVELGIPTFVMSPHDVKIELCRDFVIFDDDLLRVGGSPRIDDFKTAEFTDNSARIEQARGDFQALYRIAINTPTEAKHILELIGSGSLN
jgi:transcriptional regulator with XRE-family HTH domain